MKSIACSVLLLVCSVHVSAQWEKTFPELMPGEITKVIKRQNGNYVMLVPERNQVLELTATGDLVSSYSIHEGLAYYYLEFFSLEEASDSVLVMAAETVFCMNNPIILEVYPDSTKQLLFLSQGEQREMKYLLPITSELYLTYSHNSLEGMLQVVTRSDEVVHEIAFAPNMEVELQELNDSTIVIGTPQHIITVDTALMALDTLPGYRGRSVKINESGHLITHDQDSVWLYDEGLGLQAVIAAASGTEIKDISVGFGKVVLLHNDGLLNIYNSSLEPLGGFFLDEGIVPNDIEITPTGCLLVGKAGLDPFVKHYQFSGVSESTGFDVGLLGINLTEVPTVRSKFVPYAVGEVVAVDFPIAQFLVKNYSQDTVQTVFLASNFPWIGYDVWGCFYAEQFRKESWDQLNLAPGDSVVLEWDIPDVEYITIGAMSNPLPFCVSVELPNHSFDYNLSNDENCITTFYVDTPASVPNDPQLNIFPNPATDEVQLQWSLPGQEERVVRLHNAMGQ